MTARPTQPTTRWTAPDTMMPSRDHLQPRLPADLGALVRCGHLVAVSDGVYRRGPWTTAPPSPTPREQYDGHIDSIAAAVLDRALDRALDAHRAARAVLTPDRTG